MLMYQVVLSNCPDNIVAEKIATLLIEKRLAACVNIMPKVQSIYQWQGNVENVQEVMLLIKTKAEHFDALSALINKHHPYDVPEVIALNIQQGNNEYLDWIAGTIK